MNKNRLIIAAAGSGKTTHLVTEALKLKEKCLITTFTLANEAEIKKRIIKINKCIPDNVVVQTWFSFLFQHGVKPYQGHLIKKNIRGMYLVSGQSAQYQSEEKNLEKYYFTNALEIYSDKIAKFVVKCNEKSDGAVVDRLTRIYPNIFIDEVQDLAGYDLNILELLFKSPSNILLVGDPRQGTYSTNNSAKNKKFKKGDIVHFFEQHSNFNLDTDTTSLNTNWRCNPLICELSNLLYPDFSETKSGCVDTSEHDGVFFVRKKDLNRYLKTFSPVQLRYNSKTAINEAYEVRNFGESKGLEFPRVLVYPTAPIIKWLEDHTSPFAPTSKSKFYVAITRAKFSVGIVYDYTDKTVAKGIENFSFKE